MISKATSFTFISREQLKGEALDEGPDMVEEGEAMYRTGLN